MGHCAFILGICIKLIQITKFISYFTFFSTFLQNNAWILKIATILKRSKLPHIIGFDCQDDLIKHIHPRIIALEKITKYSVRPWKS